MELSNESIVEFIALYRQEFKEDISYDDAHIMARNLFMFYEDMIESGVMKVTGVMRKEGAAKAEGKQVGQPIRKSATTANKDRK